MKKLKVMISKLNITMNLEIILIIYSIIDFKIYNKLKKQINQ
jgi:hypothetical protein